MNDLTALTASELALRIAAREVSPVEVVEALLARIDRFDGALRSHVTVCAERAVDDARRAERDLAAGRPLGPLHGLPVSHKDNLATAGVRTTAHSRTLEGHLPDRDATAVSRLAEAGAVLLGKTNLTEFACGDMHLFGDTPNPWDPGRYAGASSSGSASAVAARLVPLATGTDTGGSIRAPASMCGVVGVKPSYGRVSRAGLVPLSWSMDTVGPMTRTVADAALLLRAMAGPDPRDPSSAQVPVPDWPALLADPRFGERLDGVRIGLPDSHAFEGLEPDVDAAVHAALAQLEALGATLLPVSLPLLGELAPIGNVLVMAEGYGLHAGNLRARGRDYGPKARRRIAAGAFYDAADVTRAEALRSVWIRQLGAAYARVDAIVTPTLPFAAFEREVQRSGPPDTSWATRGFNLSGSPALTLPCGFDRAGLPIGLQIAARPFDETTMFRVAHAYERSSAWHARTPPESDPSVAAPLPPAAHVEPPPSAPARFHERAAAERLELSEHELSELAAAVEATRDALRALPDPPRDATGMGAEPPHRFVPGGSGDRSER